MQQRGLNGNVHVNVTSRSICHFCTLLNATANNRKKTSNSFINSFTSSSAEGVASSSLHLLPSRHQQGSVRDKVGGENAHPAVLQSPLPPVVLGVGLGGDCDAVAGDDAQVAGLLA